jgi:hypothetical protein
MSVQRLSRVLLPIFALLGYLACGPAHAQSQHIRGTLKAATDHDVTVETRNGKSVTVPTTDKTGYYVVEKGSLSDVQAGKFVGITSVNRDGKPVAEEIHVFADSLRGLGEGHYPWDRDQEANMMTNANIAKVDSVAGGNVLKLDYKGGEQTINVPPGVTVVTFDKGSRADLTSGRHVFVVMGKDEAAKSAVAVVVGADGVTPPM